jgi:hypothetical protein
MRGQTVSICPNPKPNVRRGGLGIYAAHESQLANFLHVIFLVNAHGIDPNREFAQVGAQLSQGCISVRSDGRGDTIAGEEPRLWVFAPNIRSCGILCTRGQIRNEELAS